MTATPAPIPEFRDMTRARFEAEIVPTGRPAVLRGLVADWPVVQAADPVAHIVERSNAVPAEIWAGAPDIGGRFGYTADFKGFNHDRKLATIAQLADLLVRQKGGDDPFSMYAGAVPLAKHLPALLGEVPMPLLEAGRDMLVSLWLGNRTRTAAHWDLPQNLACVIAGRRRFTLFPTDQVANLYVGPIDYTLAGQPISLVDVDRPDLDRFPRFAEALRHAETAVLGPGDALYLPSLWWHAVESLDEIGAMVNFWWRDGPDYLLTPRFTLLHAIYTMKDLPERERKAWRAMLDHYVFRDHGDPMAHLPPEARGVLGESTPEGIARLHAMLVRSLQG
jgi:hypothetical protein